ncbi:hypothetical protein K3495_g1828 [Podosphaera aphanis]|nr:hypothetical protein K3495_g1828 [Podosphaera aphanis]
MATKSSQKALIADFVNVTGATDKVAQKFLKSAAWRKDIAVDNFFNAGVEDSERESLVRIFDKLHDPKDEKDILGVDTIMRYLQQDLGVDLETADIFVPLEIVQAPGLGEITKSGFVEGWLKVRCDQIPKQKAFVQNQIKLLSTDMTLFKKVYRHAFFASKETSQKALPLENAIIYWGLLFNPPGKRWISGKIDWLQLWTSFLNETWTKTVNKDMWNQVFEFFLKSMEDKELSFWSEDGAWPGVIDSFVLHVKSFSSTPGVQVV